MSKQISEISENGPKMVEEVLRSQKLYEGWFPATVANIRQENKPIRTDRHVTSQQMCNKLSDEGVKFYKWR